MIPDPFEKEGEETNHQSSVGRISGSDKSLSRQSGS